MAARFARSASRLNLMTYGTNTARRKPVRRVVEAAKALAEAVHGAHVGITERKACEKARQEHVQPSVGVASASFDRRLAVRWPPSQLP